MNTNKISVMGRMRDAPRIRRSDERGRRVVHGRERARPKQLPLQERGLPRARVLEEVVRQGRHRAERDRARRNVLKVKASTKKADVIGVSALAA